MSISKKQRDELRDFILGMCPSNQRYVERGALACLKDLDDEDKEIKRLEQLVVDREAAIATWSRHARSLQLQADNNVLPQVHFPGDQ